MDRIDNNLCRRDFVHWHLTPAQTQTCIYVYCTKPQPLQPCCGFLGKYGYYRVGGEESAFNCLTPGMRSHLVTDHDHELRVSDAALQPNGIEGETTGPLRGLRHQGPKI